MTNVHLSCSDVEVGLEGQGGLKPLPILRQKVEVDCAHQTFVFIHNIRLSGSNEYQCDTGALGVCVCVCVCVRACMRACVCVCVRVSMVWHMLVPPYTPRTVSLTGCMLISQPILSVALWWRSNPNLASISSHRWARRYLVEAEVSSL